MSSPDSPRWLYSWALGSVAFGGASLLVPLYVVELGGSALALGVLAASAAVVGAPAAVLFGRLADRAPRLDRFVEAALVVAAGVLLVLPLVQELALVVALNAVLWFVFAGCAPVLNLLAVADAEEDQWQTRIARLNAFQGWGWAGGLVVGALWTALTAGAMGALEAQRSYFLVCAGCSGLAALGLTLQAPAHSALRTLDPRRLRTVLLQAPRMNVRGATFPFTPGRVYDWALRAMRPRLFVARFTGRLCVYYGAVFLFFAGFSNFFAPLPLFLAATGFSSGAIFALYLTSSLGAAVCFAAAGRLATRHNLGLLQSAGLVLRGAAMPAVAGVGLVLGAGVGGMGGTGVLFFIIGMTWAVIAVTAATLVVRLAPEGIRGEALGFYAATSAVAGAVGSLTGGWLAETGYGLAFGVAGGLVCAGAALVLTLARAVPTVRGGRDPQLGRDA